MGNKDTYIWTIGLLIAAFVVGGVGFSLLSTQTEASEIQSNGQAIQAVPSSFTYHGYLEEDGKAVDTTYDMEFKLYTALDGGTLLGEQSRNDVQITDGLFSVELDFDSSVWDSSSVYVEVSVNKEVMSPRQKITAVPYALQAGAVNWNDVSSKPDLDNNHIGQTWSSSIPGDALLTLNNTSSSSRSSALYISGAGDDGIRIDNTGESAIWVEEAGENGAQINSAGSNGVWVGDAKESGIWVRNADFYGIHVQNQDDGMNAAALFEGNVIITGQICTAVKEDGKGDECNPVSSITSRSSQVSTSQSGNVVLNQDGEATVSVPNSFANQFSDFSYSITPVGQFAPIYISEELQNGQFKISGGEENLKVSWSVVGLSQSE